MAARWRISSPLNIAAGGVGLAVLKASWREDFERIADGDPAVVQYIGAQAAAAGPVADDCCRVVIRGCQSPAEAAARLAQFDAKEPTIADPEVPADQCVEANAAGDDIAPAEREISRLSEQLAEGLDFLGFDQRQVLPGPVRAAAMAVAFDALMGEQAEATASAQRSAVVGAQVKALYGHLGVDRQSLGNGRGIL